ncbi:unnamed protein product, partial [Ectocarpus sp. 4 AP-2014]
ALLAAPHVEGLALRGGGGSGAEGGGSGRGVPVAIRPAPAAGAGSSGGGTKPRRPKLCIECGHCLTAPGFAAFHPGPNSKKGQACRVRQSDKRPDSHRTERMSVGGAKKRFGPCFCVQC